MNNLIRVTDTDPIWPYSLAQLRIDEPQLKLGGRITPEEIDALRDLDPPIEVYMYAVTREPAIDSRTQRVIETQPIIVDGVWTTQWETVARSEEEIAQYDLSAIPSPQYIEFWDAMLVSTVYSTLLGIAFTNLAINTALTAFIAAFQDAKEGRPNPGAIQACIYLVLQASAGNLTQDNLTELQGALTAYNLDTLYNLQLPTPEPEPEPEP